MAEQGPVAGFFAPSGALPDPAIMDQAARHLAGLGWRCVAGESVFARDMRFAGPDALRLAELAQFTTGPGVDLAVAARGGYGLSRLLGDIDYAAIARAGRPVVGYSDFTAFNLALLAQAGGISFQGPAASDFADAADPDRQRNVQDLLLALRSPEVSIGFAVPAADAPQLEGLDLRGRLWGGNLSMLCALLGTAHFPRVRGGILFLEDVNEPAYRIERMLLQLWHAGVLGRQKALVLGEFSGVHAQALDAGFDLARVWSDLGERCALPLVHGLPFGHGRRRVTLAVGAAARLTVRAGQAQLRYRGHPRVARPAAA